jgi:asparagine synthase (glutamine-hydrolysing)
VYRYLALIWNRSDASQSSTAKLLASRMQSLGADWERVEDDQGFVAFHSGTGRGSCETLSLDAHHGAVFGRLFRRGQELESIGAQGRIELGESARIVATGGVHLLDHYWGRYVAAIRDESSGEISVLRDPTGTLPCFVTTYREVSIVFSDVESCLSLDLLRFSINWKYIAASVPYSALQIRDTGLNEVTEVQPGERLVFKHGRIERSLVWRPAEIARRDRIENFDEAVAAVRHTVRTCVHAWASLHRAIIHNLSGGLDSSIVLSCLKDAPARTAVTCLHYFSPATNEDERQYARLAASHMNVELVEWSLDASSVCLDRLLQIRRTAKPWFYIYDLLHSAVDARLMAEKGATGIFSGSGGDGLFLQARADLAVADHLRYHGIHPGVLRVALHAARITRTSMWPILRQGVRRHLRRPAPDILGEVGDGMSLVPRDVFEAARRDDNLIHPWIRESPDIPPGLLWHILCLSMPPGFYESFGGATDVERTAVLISQPLMELCLRIPSYVWITGGRDRAVARRAFARDLPAAIVRRTRKGAIDRHNRALLDANESFVREMLLDGLLVKNGLLDRERLALYLSRANVSGGLEYNDVLRQHLCTEVWLRRWTEIERRAAA